MAFRKQKEKEGRKILRREVAAAREWEEEYELSLGFCLYDIRNRNNRTIDLDSTICLDVRLGVDLGFDDLFDG